MRPTSIIHFERSFWTSILLGIGSTLLHFRTMAEIMKRDPVMSESADAAISVVGFAIALSFALAGLLWYQISRKASNVAKWIYILIMGFGVVSTLTSFGDPAAPKGFALAISLVSTALTALSIYFLFQPDARIWFASKQVDPKVFD